MNVCEEAMSVVLERGAAYGSPESNFGTIASMWAAYLAARPEGTNAAITAADVVPMMVLLKVARQANRPKRDNLVDIAGYALTAELLANGQSAAEALAPTEYVVGNVVAKPISKYLNTEAATTKPAGDGTHGSHVVVRDRDGFQETIGHSRGADE